MSTTDEKKKQGLSINMATAKREELVDFIHACSERIRVSKQKLVEVQGELKTQTEERELSELRTNDLDRKLIAIENVHNDKITELTSTLDNIKEKLLKGDCNLEDIVTLMNNALDRVEADVEDKEDDVVRAMRTEESKQLLEANDMKWKNDMKNFKETIEVEHQKEVEQIKQQYENEKKLIESKLNSIEKEKMRLESDISNTTQMFNDYKEKVTHAFETGKEFRKEHEHCDIRIYDLMSELEKLKYENTLFQEQLSQTK
ncbi:Myosin heavy chain [Entamoeba marina]